jgi:hypothetical protein
MRTRFARRAAARALTGPVAFLVAGMIDLCCALAALIRARFAEVSDELSGFGYVYTDDRAAQPPAAGEG